MGGLNERVQCFLTGPEHTGDFVQRGMYILLFGGTGMVGDGVLRWLIASPKVNLVVAVSRRALSVQHPKLETIIDPDMFHLQHADALRDFDACFFCLGSFRDGLADS